MLLNLWWLYVVGGVVLAFVIFQAWDRRHNTARFAREEKSRTDRQSAVDAQHDEDADRIWTSMKDEAQV